MLKGIYSRSLIWQRKQIALQFTLILIAAFCLLPMTNSWGQCADGNCNFQFEIKGIKYTGSFSYTTYFKTDTGVKTTYKDKDDVVLNYSKSDGKLYLVIDASTIKSTYSRFADLELRSKVTVSRTKSIFMYLNAKKLYSSSSGAFSFSFKPQVTDEKNNGKIYLNFRVYEKEGEEDLSVASFAKITIDFDVIPSLPTTDKNLATKETTTSTSTTQSSSSASTNTKEINDWDLWKASMAQGCIEGYRNYLSKSTKKTYADVANKRIAEIRKQEADAARALRLDLSNAGNDPQFQYNAYRKYIEDRPSCLENLLLSDARLRLAELTNRIGAFGIVLPENINNHQLDVVINKGLSNSNQSDQQLELELLHHPDNLCKSAFTQTEPEEIERGFKVDFSELEGGEYILIARYGPNNNDRVEFHIPERERSVELVVDEAGKANLRIRGGTPPFYMQYATLDAAFGADMVKLEQRFYQASDIISQNIPALTNGQSYDVRFYEEQGSSKIFFGDQTISAIGSPQSSSKTWIIFVALAFLGGLYYIWQVINAGPKQTSYSPPPMSPKPQSAWPQYPPKQEPKRQPEQRPNSRIKIYRKDKGEE